MAVEIDKVFTRGGRELIDFLSFCVLSVETDPLFLFLAREFRTLPTAAGAVALFDAFCAANAPARISVSSAIPPFDLRIGHAVEALRAALAGAGVPPPPPPLPPRYLFDAVVADVRSIAAERIAAVARRFDPDRTPLENLPGGRLTAGQRFFVEQVWQPRVRPMLVGAGFRRIANIGQP